MYCIEKGEYQPYLDVGQGGQGVMTETAHVISGVGVIERMAPIGHRQTQLAAVVDGSHVLEHGIDRFQDAPVQFLEFAQFDRIVDAVVLHVVGIAGYFESPRSSHGVTVHIGQTTVTSRLVVVDRPVSSIYVIYIHPSNN